MRRPSPKVTTHPDRRVLRRFLLQIEVAESGCWESGATKDKDGYVKFCWNGLGTGAHRHAYTWWVEPIPEGYVLDHLCMNRSCVNPAHLEPVTQLENLRRARESSQRRRCA